MHHHSLTIAASWFLIACSAGEPAPSPPTAPEAPPPSATSEPTPEGKPSFEGTWMSYAVKDGARRFDNCLKLGREGDGLVLSEYSHDGWRLTKVKLTERDGSLHMSTEVGPTTLTPTGGDKLAGNLPKGDGTLEMERADSEAACVAAAKEKLGPPPAATSSPSAAPSASR